MSSMSCPHAGARSEAIEGEGRRLSDGVADRRDRRWQSQRLYTDQLDLHHRWPDRARFQLFYEGQKPAVDVGVSVSRVGGKTQARALRETAETVRLDYAQFLELEMFTRFGGMPDARVRQQLTRGARIRAILDQPQHTPLRLADEVALVFAVQSGLLDRVALHAIAGVRRGLRDALDRSAPDAVRQIQETGTLDEVRRQALRTALENYISAAVPDAPAAEKAVNP